MSKLMYKGVEYVGNSGKLDLQVIATQQSVSGTLAAHSGGRVTMNVSVPVGYTIVAHIACWNTGVTGVVVSFDDGLDLDSSVNLYQNNTTNSTQNRGTIYLLTLCKKESSPTLPTQDDYVIETDTSGIWTYRKWNSGIAECWGIHTATISHYAQAFGGYGYTTSVSFPSGLFISAPVANYTAYIANGFALTGTQTNALSATNINVFAISSTSGSNATKWYIHAIGKWK